MIALKRAIKGPKNFNAVILESQKRISRPREGEKELQSRARKNSNLDQHTHTNTHTHTHNHIEHAFIYILHLRASSLTY
jgi:hypothetical protein